MAGDFEFLTYKETGELVAQVASYLAKLGLKAEDRVGVYGANCEEWMIAMQVGACVGVGRAFRRLGAALVRDARTRGPAARGAATACLSPRRGRA